MRQSGYERCGGVILTKEEAAEKKDLARKIIEKFKEKKYTFNESVVTLEIAKELLKESRFY